MSHRPYPDADRALRQVQRRLPKPAPTELQLKLAEQARSVLAAADEAVRSFAAGLHRTA
ncbi:hypothetical protein ACFTWD_09495 [Streptomyces sp. NPDC056943]|uniref:hypothetical protein n=1 Tax=Streptomyces sp. NPDC056943 TaxID=3345971 RepID=UPI00362BD27A